MKELPTVLPYISSCKYMSVPLVRLMLRFHRYEPVFFLYKSLCTWAKGQSFPCSPLTTSHPRLLPQTWVRSSKMYYHFFNLLMARSPGFGSNNPNFNIYKLKKISKFSPVLDSCLLSLHLPA